MYLYKHLALFSSLLLMATALPFKDNIPAHQSLVQSNKIPDTQSQPPSLVARSAPPPITATETRYNLVATKPPLLPPPQDLTRTLLVSWASSASTPKWTNFLQNLGLEDWKYMRPEDWENIRPGGEGVPGLSSEWTTLIQKVDQDLKKIDYVRPTAATTGMFIGRDSESIWDSNRVNASWNTLTQLLKSAKFSEVEARQQRENLIKPRIFMTSAEPPKQPIKLGKPPNTQSKSSPIKDSGRRA